MSFDSAIQAFQARISALTPAAIATTAAPKIEALVNATAQNGQDANGNPCPAKKDGSAPETDRTVTATAGSEGVTLTVNGVAAEYREKTRPVLLGNGGVPASWVDAVQEALGDVSK